MLSNEWPLAQATPLINATPIVPFVTQRTGYSMARLALIVLTVHALGSVAIARDSQIAIGRTRISSVHAALAANQPQKALDLIASGAVKLSPGERLLVEGRAYFMLKNFSLARRRLEAATTEEPCNPDNHYWLGRSLAAIGSPALAAAAYEKARFRGMESADLHMAWAEALRDGGQVLADLRRVQLQKTKGRLPKPGTRVNQGLVLDIVNKRNRTAAVCSVNSALGHVHLALELQPLRADALLLCGELWARAGYHRSAIQRFREAASHVGATDLARCHRDWAESLLALGDLEGYLEQVRARVQLEASDLPSEMALAYDVAASFAADRGHLKSQIRYLSQAIEHAPTAGRLLQLADAYLLSQDPEQAANCLRKALAHGPDQTQRREIGRRQDRINLLKRGR